MKQFLSIIIMICIISVPICTINCFAETEKEEDEWTTIETLTKEPNRILERFYKEGRWYRIHIKEIAPCEFSIIIIDPEEAYSILKEKIVKTSNYIKKSKEDTCKLLKNKRDYICILLETKAGAIFNLIQVKASILYNNGGTFYNLIQVKTGVLYDFLKSKLLIWEEDSQSPEEKCRKEAIIKRILTEISVIIKEDCLRESFMPRRAEPFKTSGKETTYPV